MPDKTPRKSGALPFVGNMGDGLEFVRRMWNVSGLPGLPSASGLTQYAQSLPQALPSMITPTLDIEELDKRIADLRAVEQWLNLNTNMLRTTIQSLEVQRNTIATLKSFGGSMLGAVSRGGARPQEPAADQFLRDAEARTAARHQAAAAVPPPQVPAPAPRPRRKPRAAAVATPASAPTTAADGAHMPLNPAVWWGALQDQFNKVAAAAAAEAARSDKKAPAKGKPAKAARPARTRKAG
ncbi:MAG: PhaM family polyhydroxyalkanoate granule multifunctional regulatory protein [Betaproteobacteria bacterium]|jgi:hypothetical protein